MTTASIINASIQSHQIDNRNLTIKLFNKFEQAIQSGNIDKIKKIINILYKTSNKAALVNIYEDENNSIRETHLITLACKYNQPEVLDFLLHKSSILSYLPNYGPVVDRAYIQAFCEAIRLRNSRILEKLYDYLSGDLHWLGIDENRTKSGKVQILTKLQGHLVSARDECKEYLERNKQISIDINCLLYVNSFQIELYSELSVPKQKTNSNERINEVEAIKSDLLTALQLYEQFSGVILKYDDVKCNCVGLCFLCYFNYDVYYRKLDHNIALILANNIHALKLRLVMSGDVYQEIECAVYYFLYRVNENWKLYLPENIPKFGDLNHDEENTYNEITSLPYYEMGTIIYEEWKNYRKHLRNFKEALKYTDTEINLRKKGAKLSNNESNQLLLSPYEALRDDYSLKKILEYLEHASYVDFEQDKMNSMLIIQRIIQMTGEFLKGSDKTSHLSTTTFGILRMEIPKETYNHLRDLRNDFSCPKQLIKEGKLMKRIELEQAESQVYSEVKKDLDVLKNTIHEVISTTYQPIIENHLLSLGLQLLTESCAPISLETMVYKDDIQKIWDESIEFEQYLALRKDFLSNNPCLTEKYFEKISISGRTSNKFKEKVARCKDLIIRSLIKNIPKHTNAILDGIKAIEEQNKVWESIRNDFLNIHPKVKLSYYPNTEGIKNIKKLISQKKKPSTLEIVIKQKLKDENIQDWTKEWREIRNIIQFMIEQAKAMDESKFQKLFILYERINDIPDYIGIHNVRLFIQRIKKYQSRYLQSNATPTPTQQGHKYKAIETLADKMKTSKKNNKCLEFLINRLNILDTLLEGERDIEKLILRYVYDANFRNVLEMLLSDIMNIYKERQLHKVLNSSYTKLLSECPLRNILDHGNCLLELCNVTLDDKDYPKALIKFVLTVMDDSAHLNDLFILYKEGVICDDIIASLPDVLVSNNLNDKQKSLIINFQKCLNWEEYCNKLYF